MVEKQTLYARIKEARAAMQASGIRDHAGEPGAASREQYMRILKRDLGSRAPALAGVSRASWRVHRAALLWGYRETMEASLKSASKLQEKGDLEGSMAAAERASWAINRWMEVRDAEKPEAGPEKSRKASKRSKIPKDQDWRLKVWEEAREEEKARVAVVWATGCRPWELAAGVDVELQGDRVVVTIPGAKVSERTNGGQPWRTIEVDGSSDAGQALKAVLGSEQKIMVQVRESELAWTLERIGKKLGHKARLSAYSLRHQAGGDAKAVLGKEEVAAFLGHASDRSQGAYGMRQQARGGRTIIGATASRTVRQVRNTKGPQPD